MQFNLRMLSGPQTCLPMRITWQGVLVTKVGKVSVHMGVAWNGKWQYEQGEGGVWAGEGVVAKMEDWLHAGGSLIKQKF